MENYDQVEQNNIGKEKFISGKAFKKTKINTHLEWEQPRNEVREKRN